MVVERDDVFRGGVRDGVHGWGNEEELSTSSARRKMFGILGVAMDVTTDLFFGLAVTGLVYLGPVVCAVFRSSATMSQRSGDDDYDENEDENNEHNLKIIDGMFRFLFGHHRENAERYGRLVPIRDVLLAPFFEEFVFRGLLLTVLLGTGFDKGTATAAAPPRLDGARCTSVRFSSVSRTSTTISR